MKKYSISAVFGLLTVATGLSGCLSGTGLAFAPRNEASQSQTAVNALDKYDFEAGRISLVPPKGYCIDKRSVRDRDGTGFALIARCDMLGRRGIQSRYDLALISVTIGAQSAAQTPTISDLKRSADGATILEEVNKEGLPMIRLQTDSLDLDGAAEQHWRAAFALNGHLVALALYAPENNVPLTRKAMSLLESLVSRTRAASLMPAPDKADLPRLRPVARPDDLLTAKS
jgi:hypothetical protein